MQENGLLPVWVCRCLSKLLFFEKPLPHSVHIWGSSACLLVPLIIATVETSSSSWLWLCSFGIKTGRYFWRKRKIYFVLPIKAWYKVFIIILQISSLWILTILRELMPILRIEGSSKKGSKCQFTFQTGLCLTWPHYIWNFLSFLSLSSRKMIFEMS